MTALLRQMPVWKITGELRDQRTDGTTRKWQRRTVQLCAPTFAEAVVAAEDAMTHGWSPHPHEVRLFSISPQRADSGDQLEVTFPGAA